MPNDVTRLSSNDIAFLNQLANPESLHSLMCHLICSEAPEPESGEMAPSSGAILRTIDKEVADYLTQLRRLLWSSREIRQQLRSSRSLAFLECLADESVRDEFVSVACSSRLFPPDR